MGFKSRMAALHYQPVGFRTALLWPLEVAYGLAVRLRLWAYGQGWLKTCLPDRPVISVGNLTTGGTGKTPIVAEIARGLIKAGKSVVVLSRGYGARNPAGYARALSPELGDEAYWIQQQVPEAVVIVGPNRVANYRRAIREFHPDYVLLDDGYQHLALDRGINILLVDGERLMGNGHLLPAGPLREPMEAINRADLVFVTKAVTPDAMQTVETWVRQYGGSPRPEIIPVPFQVTGLRPASGRRMLAPDQVQGKAAVAVSALAQPDRFEADMAGIGLELVRHFRFSDHHNYSPLDVETILYALDKQAQGALLVTTEKDLPKLQPLLPARYQDALHVLQIAPALDGLWFYHEFLTQMPAEPRSRRYAQSSQPAR